MALDPVGRERDDVGVVARGELISALVGPVAVLEEDLVDQPLESVNCEIKRRIDVVQGFPSDDALLGLVTAVLFEMHDEWIVFPRRYLPEGSMDTLYPAELP